MLTSNEKKTALLLAEATLEHHVQKKKIPTVQELGLAMTPTLEELHGVFVTLYHRADGLQKILRGCIGTILPLEPLYQGVIENTIKAASKDHRFLPVREEELPGLTIEINVLTLPHPIDSYSAIRLGVDGIILSQGFKRAVFLPSVSKEWKWNLEETLTQLSKKAGLSEMSWQEEATQFQVFQSESFS
jgi:AmmeMemoRadiSam system protein A